MGKTPDKDDTKTGKAAIEKAEGAAAKAIAGEQVAVKRAEEAEKKLAAHLAKAKDATAPAAGAAAAAPKKMDAKHLIAKYGHRPRYELTEKAYIDDVLYDPQEPNHPVSKVKRAINEETGDMKPLVIEFDGIPGPHMIPVNDCAKAMVAEHSVQHGRNLNPVDSLTIVGPAAKMLQPHNAVQQ